MRINTTQIPVNDELVEKTHIPMSLVVQPLAKLRPDEDPVPVIEMQKEGPVRCRRCKGYLNPWCIFSDGGRKFVCNLCGFDSDGKSLVCIFYWLHVDFDRHDRALQYPMNTFATWI